MEKSRYSIMDKITPLQCSAWEMEHEAILLRKSGEVAAAEHYRDVAHSLRVQDNHERVLQVFGYSDAQNAKIDAGLGITTEVPKVPALAGATEMTVGVDYSLMRQ